MTDSLKIENTSMEKLQKLISETIDSSMKKKLQHHVEETNEQIQRITKLMGEKGIDKTDERALAPEIEVPRGDIPAEEIVTGEQEIKMADNVKNGYAYENFEIAHYEILKNQADDANDKETKRMAEENLREEKEFVKEMGEMIPDLVRRQML